MKALVAQELCGPAGLAYTEVDDPVAGPDTVLVDVRAAGVCFPDLLLIGGQYQLKIPTPFIPGTEVVGVVQAVSLLVNYVTMCFALQRRAALRPGETVLVLGLAAGGIYGKAVLQP